MEPAYRRKPDSVGAECRGGMTQPCVESSPPRRPGLRRDAAPVARGMHVPEGMAPSALPLSPEDLTFWWADQPRQRTTMALLMLLDRPPEARRLRAAVARAVEAVPRLRQCVVDAPFDLALPRWQDDPTFDLDFHVRRYALTSEEADEDERTHLFRTLGPIYERPFERSRPLWELIEIDRLSGGSAVLFRLHHAMADGVGGNTILAALTDAERDAQPLPLPPEKAPGGWPETGDGEGLASALWRRLGEDAGRAGAVAGAALHGLRHPSALRHAAALVLDVARELRPRPPSRLHGFGRARHLSGVSLPFAPLREERALLGVRTIDLLLAGVAGAVGRWYASQGLADVNEVRTLVPVNLRPRAAQGLDAGLGNRATGLVLSLPISTARGGRPGTRELARRVREIHRRVEEARARPSVDALPALAGVLTALPRPLYRAMSLAVANAVELVVTNVPGVPVPRFLAGSEILEAYPFAPVGPHSPLSVALYGYRDRLFIGLDSDGALMPDAAAFGALLQDSFGELDDALRAEAARRAARSRSKSASA